MYSQPSFTPRCQDVLRVSDAINRSEVSLKTSAVSFAYQSDRENQDDDSIDYKRQLESQMDENLRLRRLLMLEMEKPKEAKRTDELAQLKMSLQKCNEDWNNKHTEQTNRYNLMMTRKETEISNLTKVLRQMEIENKLLTKERQEVLESSKKSQDSCQLKKIGELEYKINMLLNENQKLNQIMQERIQQVEKFKQAMDNKDNEIQKEREDMAVKFEQLMMEKTSLFVREKQCIEKNHNNILNANKYDYSVIPRNEFLKQIQILNQQNTQLGGLLCQQKDKLDQMEQQLDEQMTTNEQLLTERDGIEQHQHNQLNQATLTLEQKDKQYQEILIKFNELEKKAAIQCKQIMELEKQMEETASQSMCQEMQQMYQEQMNNRETELKRQHELQQQQLMNQLNENQTFVEELQNHLQDIHNQITRFKEEKQSLKKQNQELIAKVNQLEGQIQNLSDQYYHQLSNQQSQSQQQSYQQSSQQSQQSQQFHQQSQRQDNMMESDYPLPQFNVSNSATTIDQSLDLGIDKLPKKQNSCIKQLKMYSLAQNNKSYQAQFQMKLKKQKYDNSPVKTNYELDSFGNRDRSISCLEMIRNDYHLHHSSSDDDDTISPIEQFKMWKKQMTDRTQMN